MRHDLSDIVIRVATPEDSGAAAQVFEMAFASLRPIYKAVGELAERQADRAKEGTRLVATIDKQIVATVQYAKHAKHVHVIGLAVHPDFQRMGIARRLLDRIVAETPALGHDVVVLDTIKETGNVPIFERLGFSVFYEGRTTEFTSEIHTQLHEVKMQRPVAD